MSVLFINLTNMLLLSFVTNNSQRITSHGFMYNKNINATFTKSRIVRSSTYFRSNNLENNNIVNRRYGTTTSPFAHPKSTSTPKVEISPSDHNTKPLECFYQENTTLNKNLRNTLQKTMGRIKPTPIQSHAIPLLLQGHDVMASSFTGSGKTLMFVLPLLQKLLENTRKNMNTDMPTSLIISPTRELALQTSSVLKSFTANTNLTISLATGGSDVKSQRSKLNSHILVGTPGRIIQFIDERKLSLKSIQYVVIDEADRLLDLGFEPQLSRISKSLRNNDKQSILCSATFPMNVQRLASGFLNEGYFFVSVGKVGGTHSNIKQRFEWVDTFNSKNYKNMKEEIVVRNVKQFLEKKNKKQPSIIIFSNTKEDAEIYGKALSKLSSGVRVIHGDKPQSERNRIIQEFKSSKITTLVATDIAARGLDISTIGLVIQADTPRNIDTYTHRIGRTGRAGASGEAVTILDSKSIGIASGLIDLLNDANMEIPSWLYGMAHVTNARNLEEDMKIQAGSTNMIGDDGTNVVVTNEEYTGQDFRRTAVEGSYGSGRDTSYRSFDEEAYSSVSSFDDGLMSDDSDSESSMESDDEETLFTMEDSDNENLYYEESISNVMTTPFKRQKPSYQLLKTIQQINGSNEITVSPNKSILDSLKKGNPKLRFEYIGMFPFDLISPLLLTSISDKNEGLTRVLMVAEKPSIAKAIADALSGPRGARQRMGISRALPVYEFTSDRFEPLNNGSKTKCVIVVTSVVGHVFSLGFDTNQNEKQNDPSDFFHLPVVKQEEPSSSKLRVVDHLRALAGESDHLVLWLDCDPEGENIAHEVMAITRRAIDNNNNENRIHRARFSAISPQALRDAFTKLEKPDMALSRSVDARQELDLRIGVAITRLLTWKCVGIARRNFAPSTRLISYGPCQTPALSFCVDRAREIERFEPEKYWKVCVEAKLPFGSKDLRWKVPEKDQVLDIRNKRRKKDGEMIEPTIDNASFNKIPAKKIVDKLSGPNSYVTVTNIKQTEVKIPPPLGLNTVALLEAGSKFMGMSPKQVMNVAEKLYSAGFISYPRTETTKYDPNGFDVRAILREHREHEDWGRSVDYLLRGRYSKSGRPPLRGKDVGDHPPITPLKTASRQDVGGGKEWKVYEFIVKNFIGSLHNELSFTRTVASLSLPNSQETEFDLELVTVNSLGFADCCRWVLKDIGASNRKEESLKEGQVLSITKSHLETLETKPPRFLQEHELILMMDRNRIGTDASMAVHVSNIVDRGYVILCDETGQPLRPPRRPGGKPLPKQIGRYMVPTALGRSLLDLFDENGNMSCGDTLKDSPALLSHPSIRRQMEEEVKQIATGAFDKEFCLEKNLNWFEKRYKELEVSLTRDRINGFGQSLSQMKNNVNYWRNLGAFENLAKSANVFSSKGGHTRNGSKLENKARSKSGKIHSKTGKTSSPLKRGKVSKGQTSYRRR